MEKTVDWPDLSSRTDSTLEWWFVQGWVEGERTQRLDFMLSLFRQAGPEDDGHMLLVSTLDPATGKCETLSQVSPKLVDNFLSQTRGEINGFEVDRRIVDAVLAEIGRGDRIRTVQGTVEGLDPRDRGKPSANRA